MGHRKGPPSVRRAVQRDLATSVEKRSETCGSLMCATEQNHWQGSENDGAKNFFSIRKLFYNNSLRHHAPPRRAVESERNG